MNHATIKVAEVAIEEANKTLRQVLLNEIGECGAETMIYGLIRRPDRIKIADLADREGVLINTLLSRWHRLVGVSVREFTKVAVEYQLACVYGSCEIGTYDTALVMGWSSPSDLHRTVKTVAGMTLERWRKNVKPSSVLVRWRSLIADNAPGMKAFSIPVAKDIEAARARRMKRLQRIVALRLRQLEDAQRELAEALARAAVSRNATERQNGRVAPSRQTAKV